MDISLHWIEKGEGFPLLLLHGNGESTAYFQYQMDPLARVARVIAIDTRGHGLSPRGEKPFSLAQFADDLKDFMDEHGIHQADLLGFSDGGNIAMLFSIQYPHRVRKLVLNGANLSPSGVRPIFQIPICLAYGLYCLFSFCSPKHILKKELFGLMVREPRLSHQDLSAITVPTLVIAGTHDLIRTRHTESIAHALPNAQLCFLPGDHFIARKNAEAFNDAVVTFLSK